MRNVAVAEYQTDLKLEGIYAAVPVLGADLRSEIAAAWGLPLGQRVEVSLRNERCALQGVLELRRAPDYPWDGRQALQLVIAGFVFSSRDMERWAVL